MFWMTAIGAVPWAVLSFIEAGWFALMGVVAAGLLPRLPAAARPWAFAALWTLLEFARSWGKCAFPWFLLAATQARPASLPVVQLAEWTGQWGVSFAVAAVSGLAVEAFRARRDGAPKRAAGFAAVALAVPAALYGFGAARLASLSAASEAELPRHTVAVVQGNIPKMPHADGASDDELRRQWEEYRRRTLDTYVSLTREAAQSHPTFVLWPETVVPGQMLREPDLEAEVVSLARETRTPLLVGTPDADFFTKERWNTAVYYDAAGLQRARYDKTRLVPMGEFFLFSDVLGPIYENYGWRPGMDFTPGTQPGIFPVGGYGSDSRTDIGMLICYESVFPELARDRVRRGAQLLVQMTSDQTFDGTPNPQQHADLAVLRAVETRRYFVRAGATGLSEIIDPKGSVVKRLPSGVTGTFAGEVRLRSDRTFFVRHGDWFVGLCALGVAGAFGFTLARRSQV
jgi:apolipoprotein N-acyltransferase